MSSPTPPSTSPSTPALSAFTPLRGGESQAIAPGSQLVTLNGSSATWWESTAPVSAALPNIPVDGAQWTADGKSLHVGLGTLDLAARTWRGEPSLARVGMRGPRGESPVREVAWFATGEHVALLLESSAKSGKRTHEVVVIDLADGRERGRHSVERATKLIASADRVLVAAKPVVVLDLDAAIVAEPTPMPPVLLRVREGAGRFAAIGPTGEVVLVRASDGAIVATWDAHAEDAVPFSGGVVAVDLDGKVSVGCVEGNTIRSVAEAQSGVKGAVIRLVGDRVVVAGAGADPVRVATFKSPCR